MSTQVERVTGMSRATADAVLSKMKTSSSYGWLRIAEMKVDPRAQRLLRRVWVKRHVSQFDANQIGTIVISRRRDGSLWIIDGQHRVELLRSVGWGDQSVYCEIFDGLTVQEEAALFLKRNDKISVRTFDKFQVSLTEQDETACAIAKIVTGVGLSIAEGSRDGSVSAVSALLHLYGGAGVGSEQDGAAALKKTLQTINAAWGNPAANFQGQVIEGIGLVHLRYGSKVDQGALVSTLSKIGGGAVGLLGQAKGLRETHGGSLPYAVGAAIALRYNRGRRAGKLDSWWS